jgi:hypothetical protein
MLVVATPATQLNVGVFLVTVTVFEEEVVGTAWKFVSPP